MDPMTYQRAYGQVCQPMGFTRSHCNPVANTSRDKQSSVFYQQASKKDALLFKNYARKILQSCETFIQSDVPTLAEAYYDWHD